MAKPSCIGTSDPPISKSEKAIQNDIRLALGLDPNVVLWRNNVGSVERPGGGKITFGLCIGSADLIGMVRLVGRHLSRFLALEVKRPGENPTAEQRKFLQLVQDMGGVSAVVRSIEDALDVVRNAQASAEYRGTPP